MSQLLFLQALRDVGAEREHWRCYRTCMTLTLHCLAEHGFDINVYDSGAVELVLHQDVGNYADGDDAYLGLRKPDGNLVEAVRFVENLRRLLSGEPSLEVERLQKAMDQALFFAEIRPTEFDDDTLYARSTSDQNPMLFRDRFPELAAELKRRAGEVQG